jgi:hypothetical protein
LQHCIFVELIVAVAMVHSKIGFFMNWSGQSATVMKWITRERVKVDRVACPWLIRKFVDKQAEFFFVPADKVMDEARRLGATPFDVKDVELGHHGKAAEPEAPTAKKD